MTSHLLQAWHHTPCIRHHTNCIFVITTAPLISHPLLYDITPTICVISYALYITSYPLLMSSHYCTYDSTNLPLKQHPVCSSKYTPSLWHHSHMSVSSPPLYWEHHTQSLYDIILSIGIASFALLKTLHPHFMKSNHHFYDITPTVFDIVLTLFLSPHPLYWWYHTNSIYEISSSTYVDIISVAYNNISTIFVSSQPLYLCLTPTISMISHPLYIWHSSHYMFNIRYTI